MSTVQRSGAERPQASPGVPGDVESDGDPAQRVRAMLAELVEQQEVSPAWADALDTVVEHAAPLHQDGDVCVSDLVHRVMRAEATRDAAPPEKLETIAAPDLALRPEGSLHELPEPDGPDAFTRLLEVVHERRSTPLYGERAMTVSELSGVLAGSLRAKDEVEFAYQRRDIPKRVFPTAGGLQPIDCYVIASRVEGLEPGIYAYDPVGHGLVLQEAGDARPRLLRTVIMTEWLFDAPAVIALSANLDRVLWKYGSRAYRYTHLDTGAIVGQLYLAATALSLSVNAVAAFFDDAFNDLLRLDGTRRFGNLLIGVGPTPSLR